MESPHTPPSCVELMCSDSNPLKNVGLRGQQPSISAQYSAATASAVIYIFIYIYLCIFFSPSLSLSQTLALSHLTPTCIKHTVIMLKSLKCENCNSTFGLPCLACTHHMAEHNHIVYCTGVLVCRTCADIHIHLEVSAEVINITSHFYLLVAVMQPFLA